MIQLGKALAYKFDDPSSIPRTHMVGGESGLQQVALCALDTNPQYTNM